MDDTIIITDNFLIGLARRPDIIMRFPFIKQLNTKMSIQQPQGCGSCAAKSVNRNTIKMTSEVKRILATMQEPEVKAFKEMIGVKYYKVTYDHRGQQTTVTR